MERLAGNIQNYAWGSHHHLASLRGEADSSEPEAELWLGAHPKSPSTLPDRGVTLAEAIEANPERELGDVVLREHGSALPFLLKLLAADQPLSIQAHPSLEQARAGFAREDAAGIDRGAFNRTYRDDNHKPELICAITPFEAMIGFRAPAETAELFRALALDVTPALAPIVATLRQGDIHAAVETILTLDKAVSVAAVDAIRVACSRAAPTAWAAEADLLARLSDANPGDPGVVTAALLNRVMLDPGEALYLDAGHLHAYVGGFGVEVMANSDNVLRGGLTPKYIDVPELLSIVVAEPLVPDVLTADEHGRYTTPAPEFALTRWANADAIHHIADGPQIVVAVGSPATIAAEHTVLTLQPGDAAWLAHGDQVSMTAAADVFIASVGRSRTLING